MFFILPVISAAAIFPDVFDVSYGNSSSAATSSSPIISAFLLDASVVWREAVEIFSDPLVADCSVNLTGPAVVGAAVNDSPY